ncbi:thiosulfate sulfurtransferase [Sporobolomyces koalae]|uniref:thiosulfate sulfurtransferase n=1 Tax=Sporobolomyces koalae TaxID=500713 RepID=UPI0031813A75
MSTSSRAVGLVSPKELHSWLSDPSGKGKDVVVLDGSWFMPNLDPPRSGFKEFRTKRIENSAFWDLDLIASKSDLGNVPHEMPSRDQFEDAASRLGIKRDSHVVIYDTTGVFSSPRTAFTFKHFDHKRVSLLDGGLPRWEAENLPIDTKIPSHVNPHSVEESGKKFHPILSELLYATKPRIESYFIADIEENFTDYRVEEGSEQSDVVQWQEMNANVDKGEQGDIVLDARPSGRFDGTAPEPRAGLSSGHMPYSLNLPSPAVLSAESSTNPPFKTLLSKEELERVFVGVMGQDAWEAVKKGERKVINTCGSGMTAAILWLALQRAGASEKVSIYDESWTGYAQRAESKIVKA